MIILQAKHKNRGVFIYLNHVSNHATPKYKKAEKGKNECRNGKTEKYIPWISLIFPLP